MNRLDLSDAALETLSDSDVVKTAKEIGMKVHRRGEPRENTLRRIRALREALRDQPATTTETSGRGLEQVSWRTYLCITFQAVVIAGFVSACLWYCSALWIFSNYLDVYGLQGALEMRKWNDLLFLGVFLILVSLWFGPARKIGPMYFYLPSGGGSRPSRPDPSIMVKSMRDEPTSIPTEENAGRDLSASFSGENDAEREYTEIRRCFEQDESAVDAHDMPEFPASVQQYQQMSKASILLRLAYVLRRYSRVQRDFESVQTNTNSLMLFQGSESQPLATTSTGSGPIAVPYGFDWSSAEVESIRSERDVLQRQLRQATEQAEAAKGKADASEKVLKMQEEIEEEKRRLKEEVIQAKIFEERSRKILEESKKENERLVAELVKLRGKVWTYLRLRPKVNRDKENQFIDLTSPDDFYHSLILRGGIDKKHPTDSHYEFDRVFHQTDTNQDVYEHVRPMVQAAMNGLDVAIILEGPSGSGKSYTMFGQPDGIAFSVARHILQLPSEGEGSSGLMQIRISSFKVYKEKILDATISKGENTPLYIRDEKDTKIQVYRDRRYTFRVDGKLISTTEQLTSELVRMLNAREQRETVQNATSSRGHAICKLEFSSFNTEAGETKTSSLFLVDLAGPESFKQSPNPEETRTITKGRTEIQHRLCEMIELHQLDTDSEKRKQKARTLRINLKNSKLTHILQDCFLGEPRILVIGTVNPYAADEHRSRIRETFEFATKIRMYNLASDHGRLGVRPNTP